MSERWKQIRELEIEAERDPRKKFQHDHFRTEPAPDGPKLQTDRAAADDEKFLRRLLKGERLGAAHDHVAVELHVRQLHRHAAGRDDDVRRFDLLAVAFVRLDRDAAGGRDRSQALKRRDLVSLHQRFHAAVHRLHDLVFAREHLRQIKADVFQNDAVLGGFLFRENVMVARSEERLARDAPDVQTGAAEFLVLLDDGRFQAKLRRANRRDVTAGSRADDDDIKFIHVTCQSTRICKRDRLLGRERCSEDIDLGH